jgi:sulfur carrier protein
MSIVDSDTVALRLDDRPHRVAAGTCLDGLVASLGHAPEAVSTAVNGEFVARSQRSQHLLKEGDSVLLFQPIVGG